MRKDIQKAAKTLVEGREILNRVSVKELPSFVKTRVVGALGKLDSLLSDLEELKEAR